MLRALLVYISISTWIRCYWSVSQKCTVISTGDRWPCSRNCIRAVLFEYIEDVLQCKKRARHCYLRRELLVVCDFSDQNAEEWSKAGIPSTEHVRARPESGLFAARLHCAGSSTGCVGMAWKRWPPRLMYYAYWPRISAEIYLWASISTKLSFWRILHNYQMDNNARKRS